jgi:hypothetical protein
MKSVTKKISTVTVNGILSSNNQIIAEVFNNYFISVAQNILIGNLNNMNISSNNDNPFLYLSNTFN